MKTTFKLTPSQSHQGASKNVPNGPANTWKTVETVKKLRDPGATPLKRGVNEIEPTLSSAPAQSHSSEKFSLMHRTLPTPGRIMVLSLATSALLLQLRSAGAQNAYFQHNLVSDIAGYADRTDTNLVNPWGIALSGTSPFWLSDNHAEFSTNYNGSGAPQSLVVIIPPPSGGTPPCAPTGIVCNNTLNFTVA